MMEKNEKNPNGEVKEEYNPTTDLDAIIEILNRNQWRIVGKFYAKNGLSYNLSSGMSPHEKYGVVNVLLEEVRLELQATLMQERLQGQNTLQKKLHKIPKRILNAD